MPSSPSWRQILIACALLLLLPLLYALIAPVQTAGFIFDDLPNLQPWAQTPHLHRLIDLWNFANSSLYPPGRPLALLSFCIDDQNFPPDAVLLHRTNLLIHLLNTVLVFAWLRLLLRGHLRQADAWALIASLLWALAPIQLGCVAYIIQRMNLLCTSFSLLALMLITTSLQRQAERPCQAEWGLLLSNLVLMPLAVLCKENGILVGLFGFLILQLLYPIAEARRRLRAQLILLLPLALLVAWLLLHLLHASAAPARSFTLTQRLWTEARVVCEYLGHILLPSLNGHSLYRDDYPISRGLLSPWTTLAAVVTLLVLLAAGIRSRLPVLTRFGLLFFLAGLALESTIIPLEIYFEHRNYLPSLGLWIALLPGLQAAYERRAAWTSIGLALYLGLEMFCCHELAQTWGHPQLRARIWLQEQPHSLRAAFDVARLEARANRPRQALAILQAEQSSHADSFSLAASIALLQCHLDARPYAMSTLESLAEHSPASSSAAMEIKHLAECPSQSHVDLDPLYQAMLRNPHCQDGLTQRYLLTDLAHIEAQKGHLDAAAKAEVRAYQALPRLDSGLNAAIDLIRLHRIAQAHSILEDCRQQAHWIDRLRYPTAYHNLILLLPATAAHESPTPSLPH